MVLANVTSTRAAAAGFATVFPCGGAVPEVSNLNFVPGVDVANAALLRIGTGGAICATASVATDLIVDVVGYVEGSTDLVPLDPQRIYDTRKDAEPECNLAISHGSGNSVTVTDLRTLASTSYSWPALITGGPPVRMSILPTCDGFVTLVRRPPDPTYPYWVGYEVWEFRFDGTSAAISHPAFRYSDRAVPHVTSWGELLVLDGSVTTGDGEFVAIPPTLPGYSFVNSLGVLFDVFFVFAYSSVGGSTLLVTIGPDPVGVISTEEAPAGSTTLEHRTQASMYSASGAYMLTLTSGLDPSTHTVVARPVVSIGPSVLATPPVGAPGATFARWLAEGELVVCHNSETYRWSIFSTTMTLLPGVECPAAVR